MLALAVWAAGCDPNPEPAGPSHDATSVAAACLEAGPPELRIGSDDGPVFFSSIGSIVPVPSSTHVVVLDPMAGEARFFDAGGEPVGTLAGPGAGPGELSRGLGMSAGVLGDSLWIYDPILRRTSIFTADGALVRTVAVPTGGVVEQRFTLAGAVPVTSDHWLGVLSWDGSAVPVPVVVVDPHGRNPRVLAWSRPDDSPRAMLEVPGRGAITTIPPIRFRSLSTRAADIGIIVLAEATRNEDTYEVRWFDPGNGADPVVSSGTYQPISVTREERDVQVARLVDQLAHLATLSSRQVEEAFDFPLHHPPFERALPGTSDAVWFERGGFPVGARWEEFRPTGPTGCAIELEPGERLLHVDSDGIWIRETDTLGVPVAVFRRWVSPTGSRDDGAPPGG